MRRWSNETSIAPNFLSERRTRKWPYRFFSKCEHNLYFLCLSLLLSLSLYVSLPLPLSIFLSLSHSLSLSLSLSRSLSDICPHHSVSVTLQLLAAAAEDAAATRAENARLSRAADDIMLELHRAEVCVCG